MFHDSRNTAYRFPFGAVPSGTEVSLHLDVQGDGTETVFLRLWIDNAEKRLPMACEEPQVPGRGSSWSAGTAGVLPQKAVKKRRYGVTFTVPEKGCLVWYYFIVRTGSGTVYYGNNPQQRGGCGNAAGKEPPSFQITVYDAGSATPDWLKHTIFYQIFPDRFNRGPVPAERFLGKKGAVLHSSWEDAPAYVRDAKGDVLYYDFFGGTLEGILEKLDDLAAFGVNCLYLNPIFKARSNHRYDTGDYKAIDPFLGDETVFRQLCREARKRHMRIILDGVFSHTGADSRYFNQKGSYAGVGAAQSKASPWYPWYRFRSYPDDYRCWWGDRTLPEVEESEPSYLDFIIRGRDSVLKKWLRDGISGWRLDVVDELPDVFLEPFYRELKARSPDAALIGEVWEDASRKVSYGVQRQYLSGGKLDSVMNYVLRSLMLAFALGNASAEDTDAQYLQQMENYPRENLYAMMNLLGSHDVERLLTVLGSRYPEKTALRMDGLLRAWQMTLPGAPAIYYGDEAGLTGGKDPENRKPYPWGHENEALLACCRSLNALRNGHTALRTGRFATVFAGGDLYIFARFIEGRRDQFGKPAEDGVFFTALNRSRAAKTVTVDTQGLAYGELELLWSTERFFEPEDGGRDESSGSWPAPVQNGCFTLTLPPCSAVICRCREPGHGLPEPGPGRAGVLLHPTSLPGAGSEEMAASIRSFLDFLSEAGQDIWQILPLNPPGLGDSPYLSLSAFAGDAALFGAAPEAEKGQEETEAFAEFCRSHAYWLDDYALFMALRGAFDGKPWQAWPEPYWNREKEALDRAAKHFAGEILARKREQYHFYRNWQAVKSYAHQKGIRIFGDMPIFVAADSADVWAHRGYFQLDGEGNPTAVAGVPPDYFSETGQVWGNPLYRWEEMEKDGWRWWQERFRVLAEQADIVRIDHFRGFAAAWAVDAVTRDARRGHWTPGPGADLFRAVLKALPGLQLVAEDLGIITPDVCRLRDGLGLPGMKVLQFHCHTRTDGETSFDTEPGCVAYTGTHDNNTLRGWFTEELDAAGRARILRMVHDWCPEAAQEADGLRWQLLAYLYGRRARTVIVPLQDLLWLPSSCRMNTPGTATGNWHWQCPRGVLTPALAARVAALVRRYRKG